MPSASKFSSVLLLMLCCGVAAAGEPKPEALKAWERYIALTELRIEIQHQSAAGFLDAAGEPAEKQAAMEERAKGGEIVVEKLTTADGGKAIHAPGALVHHWVGTAFIEKGTIAQAFAVLQDYDHHSTTYAPEVQRSKLITRSGDDFSAYLRFLKKKVITVVLDTYHQAHYGRLDATRAYSRSYTTKVVEIEDPGTPGERGKSPQQEQGFMWKMNTYWRFQEKDGGLYIQCEAITLTRNVPFGLAWIIEPFITSIPRESLNATLTETRKALVKELATH